MTNNFENAMDWIIKKEGGVSDLEGDSGGFTLFGISRKYHPNAPIWTHVDQYIQKNGKLPKGDALLAEFQADVYGFYREHFWDAVKASELPSGVDFFLFDYGVQHSTKDACKALQRALEVTQDGNIGEVTLKAVKQTSPKQILKSLLKYRTAEYISSSSTGRVRFAQGWANRLVDCFYLAQSMLKDKG